MSLTRVALVVICVVALALRLVEAADGRDQPPDAVAYGQLAQTLHEEGRFGFERSEPPTPPQPASTYPPGLPLFAAGIYELAGEDRTLVRIILALIGAAAVPLTFLLGRRLASEAVGLAAAALLAVLPAMTEYAALLLTEPFAATLLIGAVLAGLRASDDGSRRWAGATGVLLGMLTLIRAEYLALVVLLPLLSLVRRPQREALKRLAAPAALMGLAAVIVIAPWTARNAFALDRFVPVSTGGGKILYIGTSLEADGDAVKLRALLLAERPALAAKLRRFGPADDPANFVLERALLRVAREEDPRAPPDQVLTRLGREQLADAATGDPLGLVALLARKSYETWTQAARDTMETGPWRAIQFALVIGALGGLICLGLRRRFEALVLGVILLFITALGAVLIASPRRALVAMPLLCALGATGFGCLFEMSLRSLRRRTAPS